MSLIEMVRAKAIICNPKKLARTKLYLETHLIVKFTLSFKLHFSQYELVNFLFNIVTFNLNHSH